MDLTLQTVAAVGSKLSPNKNWVSYLVREKDVWHRSTVWTLPAQRSSTSRSTTSTGRAASANPVPRAGARHRRRQFAINGKPTSTIDPDAASHTFAIPTLGVIVPVLGVADDAPKQCDYAPCPMTNAHETITFTFRTGKPGRYRWQCFVPCAAGFVYGFGGPMQTVGYMDGYVNVV